MISLGTNRERERSVRGPDETSIQKERSVLEARTVRTSRKPWAAKLGPAGLSEHMPRDDEGFVGFDDAHGARGRRRRDDVVAASVASLVESHPERLETRARERADLRRVLTDTAREDEEVDPP